ncbi:MAG: L,D-transpeptidase family protein [Ignavibacteriaceae bacterium]|nr:L,D-transpeptidase family protein [Ignavibacteriaceae bacterium]
MKSYIRVKAYLLILIIVLPSYSQSNNSPVPRESKQLIIVLTDSTSSTKGFLYRCDKKNGTWKLISSKLPIVLGRNGLGWGRGLHQIDSSLLPVKVEGDGKSPAGVFTLSYAFGYAKVETMKNLKFPYIEVTSMLECIDDVKSKYYNQLVNNNEADTIDWQSSEKMYFADVYYEQGIVVDQNINPIEKGAGSCIFLHNWATPNETSAGCTEMAPENLKEIINWLNYSDYPILVQLTEPLYRFYQQQWELPVLENLNP